MSAQRSSQPGLIFKLAALCFSFSMVLMLGECATRIRQGAVFSLAKARTERGGDPDQQRAIYDPYLGYVPKPGKYVGDFTSTITPDGLRRGDDMVAPTGASVLAIGDSFAFGDDVDDDESWPAYLEGLLDRPVLNGGVFGYGLDQSVLRAEKLIVERKPGILVLSMIADDLDRSEMSYRYSWKPYFSIVEGVLQRQNDPVPTRRPPAHFRTLRATLSYSYFAHAIFRRVAPYWWFLDGTETRAHHEGVEVGVLLMERLARVARENQTKVLVVAQCDGFLEAERLGPILESAKTHGMESLDLAGELRDLLGQDEERRDRFYLGRREGQFGGHHTATGNHWIAERLSARLHALGW